MNIGAMDAFSLGVAASAKNSVKLETANAVTAGVSGFASIGRGMETGSFVVQATRVEAKTGAVAIVDAQGVSVVTSTSVSIVTGTGYTGTVDATYLVKVDTVNASSGMVTGIAYSTDGGITYKKLTLDMTAANGNLGTSAATVLIDGIKIQFDAGTQYKAGQEWTFKATAATVNFQLRESANGTTAGTLIGNQVLAS